MTSLDYAERARLAVLNLEQRARGGAAVLQPWEVQTIVSLLSEAVIAIANAHAVMVQQSKNVQTAEIRRRRTKLEARANLQETLRRIRGDE